MGTSFALSVPRTVVWNSGANSAVLGPLFAILRRYFVVQWHRSWSPILSGAPRTSTLGRRAPARQRMSVVLIRRYLLLVNARLLFRAWFRHLQASQSTGACRIAEARRRKRQIERRSGVPSAGDAARIASAPVWCVCVTPVVPGQNNRCSAQQDAMNQVRRAEVGCRGDQRHRFQCMHLRQRRGRKHGRLRHQIRSNQLAGDATAYRALRRR